MPHRSDLNLPSRVATRPVAPIVALAAALLCGCTTLRPPAQRGVDLLENGNRSAVARTFAGLGATVGVAASLPFALLLSPSYLFEDEGDWEIIREPQGEDGSSVRGDIRIPLCLVPVEYGRGLGAAVLGSPAAWIEEAAYGEPAPPEGWLEETPDDVTPDELAGVGPNSPGDA